MENKDNKNSIEVNEEEINKIIEKSKEEYENIITPSVKANKKISIISIILIIMIVVILGLIARTASNTKMKVNNMQDTKEVTLHIQDSELTKEE